MPSLYLKLIDRAAERARSKRAKWIATIWRKHGKNLTKTAQEVGLSRQRVTKILETEGLK